MSTPAFPGHAPGSREYRRLVFALFLAGIATFSQLYSPQAALSSIARDLSVSPADSALVISTSTIGLAIGVIPWSAVADRIGRVRAMSVAVGVATVFGILVPFAPTFPLLLAGRGLEGLFIGGVPALALAYVADEVSKTHAARAAGVYVAGTTIGGLLGRLLTGSLTTVVGWRMGVLATAVLCAIVAGLFVVLVPAARGFAGGLGSGLSSRLAVNLRSRRQLAVYAQGLLLMGGFVALYNFLAFRLERAPYNLDPGIVSLVFIAYLAGTVSSTRAGALAGRLGRLPVLLGSTAVMAAGVLLTFTTPLPLVLTGLVLATGGFFGAHSIASGWASADSPARAQASSLYNLAYYAGSSLFGWLGGVFFVALGWNGTATMVLALIVAAALVAALTLPARAADDGGAR